MAKYKYILFPVKSILNAIVATKEGKTITGVDVLKSVNLKEWYADTYPTDDWAIGKVNETVNLLDVFDYMLEGGDFYDITGVDDSMFRERVFYKMSNLLHADYDVMYNLWMMNSRTEGKDKIEIK